MIERCRQHLAGPVRGQREGNVSHEVLAVNLEADVDEERERREEMVEQFGGVRISDLTFQVGLSDERKMSRR